MIQLIDTKNPYQMEGNCETKFYYAHRTRSCLEMHDKKSHVAVENDVYWCVVLS
jgi:hypothetical protein